MSEPIALPGEHSTYVSPPWIPNKEGTDGTESQTTDMSLDAITVRVVGTYRPALEGSQLIQDFSALLGRIHGLQETVRTLQIELKEARHLQGQAEQKLAICKGLMTKKQLKKSRFVGDK